MRNRNLSARPWVALVLLSAAISPGCRSSEGSVSLYYPADYPKEAVKLLDVFSIDRENIPIAAAEINCESLLAKAIDGAAPAGGEQVDVPLSPPFDGKTIEKFPRGSPVVFLTAYNESSEIKKPILVGCSEEFDSSGGADIDINLQVLIPADTRVQKVSGDLQVSSQAGPLPQVLCVLVDATTPSMRDQRYALPGIRVSFQPGQGVALADQPTGQPIEVVTQSNGQACVTASLPGELGSFEVEARAAELYEARPMKEESSVAAFLLSAVAPVEFEVSPAVTPGVPGTPIAVDAGDVDGDGNADVALLTCDGPAPGCLEGSAGSAPFGTAHLALYSGALSASPREAVRSGLGRAPTGLDIGHFTSRTRMDVAVLNGRSERCLNRVSRPCENSELRFLTWQGDNLVDAEQMALTASNAVGLSTLPALTSGQPTGFDGLVTAGQGRKVNPQPCKLNVCLPFDPYCQDDRCIGQKPCDCSSGSCVCGEGELCFQDEAGTNLCRPVKRSCAPGDTRCTNPTPCDCQGPTCTCDPGLTCFHDDVTPTCYPYENACRPALECGCPAGELCECPPEEGCGADETLGFCLGRDKELEVVHNRGDSAPMRFQSNEACTEPALTCVKTGTGRPTTSCRCLDNTSGLQNCSARDDCGCAVPNRITLTGRGSLTPFGIGPGVLRDRAVNGYEFAVATAGGLDFVARGTGETYSWADRPVVNAPIHGVDAVDLDGDEADDLVWYARSACAAGPNLQVQCPVVNLDQASGAKGCFGIYLRYIDPVKRLSDVPISAARSCRRIMLEDVPSGMCVGDFNADGSADVALTSSDSNQVLVHPGDGRGGLLYPPQRLGLPFRGGVITCEDLNGDGRTDIAVASKESGSIVFVESRRAQ